MAGTGPQIGPITGASSGSAGSTLMGLGALASMIPALVQGRKDRIAQQQQQQLLMQAQKMQLGQQIQGQLAQQARNDPRLLADPNYTTKAQAIGKQFGFDVPLVDGPNGQKVLDIQAFTTKPQVTQEDYEKGLALPPQQRAGVANLYQWNSDADKQAFLQAQQVIPPSAGSLTALANQLPKMVEAVGQGKSTPQAFASYIRSNYANLKAAGQDPDAYLSPDFQQHMAGSMVEAQIDKMKSLGIHLQNEDQYRDKLLQTKIAEFNVKEGDTRAYQQGQLAVRNRMADASMARVQVAQQNLGLAAARLDQGERRLDLAAQAQQTNTNRFSQALFKNAYDALDKDYNATQTQYDSLAKAVSAAATANPGQAADPKLLEQMDTLHKRLADLQPKLKAAQETITQAPAKALSTATGQRTTAITAQYGAGRPVPDAAAAGYTFTGEQRADGAYQVRGPGGRMRWWKP